MLLYATVQGLKGIIKLFAARLSKRRVPRLGGACTKDWGPPRREKRLISVQGTCSSPVPLREKDWISSVCCCSFLNVWICFKNVIVPIYWWKRCHSFIYWSQNYSFTSIFNRFHSLLRCPFSCVLMPGCSMNCRETHRDPLNLEFIPSFVCAEHSVSWILAPKFRFKEILTMKWSRKLVFSHKLHP